ncbi:unnamed protein product [Mytilus edulis]|uniref:Uncharacterized protein n=1 Tax=Mytilus edulis TaxID=6550 RepID=A0A8S3Q712_MYTED|nr:unnamed protein product [Mytilus edulis]
MKRNKSCVRFFHSNQLTEARSKFRLDIIIQNEKLEQCRKISLILRIFVDIKLTPPNPVIEANAGFHGELSLTKASEETFEEELTWSIDNQISVPPKFKTKAELVIKEDDYTSHFKTESQFRGKVHVTLRNKKDNSPITTITGDVKQIFTKDKGFRVDKTGIYYVTEGRCKCRFGIEQHVCLKQEKLVSAEATED